MIPADAPYNSVRKRRTYLVDSVFPAPLSPLMMMDWFSFKERMSLKALSAAMREGRGGEERGGEGREGEGRGGEGRGGEGRGGEGRRGEGRGGGRGGEEGLGRGEEGG